MLSALKSVLGIVIMICDVDKQGVNKRHQPYLYLLSSQWCLKVGNKKLILSPKLSGYYQLCLLPHQETALVCQKERNHECCELLIDNVAF